MLAFVMIMITVKTWHMKQKMTAVIVMKIDYFYGFLYYRSPLCLIVLNILKYVYRKPLCVYIKMQ